MTVSAWRNDDQFIFPVTSSYYVYIQASLTFPLQARILRGYLVSYHKPDFRLRRSDPQQDPSHVERRGTIRRREKANLGIPFFTEYARLTEQR